MDFLSLGIGLLLGFVIAYLFLKIKGNEPARDSAISEIERDKLEEFKIRNSELESRWTGLLDKNTGLEGEKGKLEGRIEESIKRFEDQNITLINERKKAGDALEELAKSQANLNNSEDKLSNQKKEIEQLQKKFTTEFENIANKLLEQKSEKFTERNKENMDRILTPLKEKIVEFEKSVTEKYITEGKERSAMAQQIKDLSRLNQQMSEEANNLTRALKGDSKTQGDWGEIRLEMVLEKSGLNKDIHFTTQETHRDEDGNLKKPDFIVNLPDDKHLIIDSKVSLTAYEAFHSSSDEVNKAVLLKEHLKSIRGHIKDLWSKRYQDLEPLNTPDFVLMYVPIEPAFNLAVQNDPELYQFALEKNIVIVTTSTLLATMKTVATVWQQEAQRENILEIVRKSTDLYDKFVGFVESMSNVGKSLDKSREAYDVAFKRLKSGKGNLISRVEGIRKLGLNPKKRLDKQFLEEDDNLMEDSDGQQLNLQEQNKNLQP